MLSVYLNGLAADPADQRSWRTQLDHGVVIVVDTTEATIYVHKAGGLERTDRINAHHPRRAA